MFNKTIHTGTPDAQIGEGLNAVMLFQSAASASETKVWFDVVGLEPVHSVFLRTSGTPGESEIETAAGSVFVPGSVEFLGARRRAHNEATVRALFEQVAAKRAAI